jgi:hypothetical protein
VGKELKEGDLGLFKKYYPSFAGRDRILKKSHNT